MLRLVTALGWLRWLGSCELFSEVDMRLGDGPVDGGCADAAAATAVCSGCAADWPTACAGNWHGDFGECAFCEDDIAASADVDDESRAGGLGPDAACVLSAMEDECNGFRLFDGSGAIWPLLWERTPGWGAGRLCCRAGAIGGIS